MKENNAHYLDKTELDINDDILFTAHGYSYTSFDKYKDKYKIYFSTCPLILDRYKAIKQYNPKYLYLFLGKKDHQETLYFLENFHFLIFIDVNKDYLKQLNIIKEEMKDFIIISQTTNNIEKYNEFLNICNSRFKINKSYSISF